jgi:hypothetical protein
MTNLKYEDSMFASLAIHGASETFLSKISPPTGD